MDLALDMEPLSRRATLPTISSPQDEWPISMSFFSRLRRTHSQTNLAANDEDVCPLTPIQRRVDAASPSISASPSRPGSRKTAYLSQSFRGSRDGGRMHESTPIPSVISSDPTGWYSRASQREAAMEKGRSVRTDKAQKARSDAIDKALREEVRQRKRAGMRQQTVLLLGQSQAGKTTILKQMRAIYAPDKLEKTRSSWVAVIHLNIIIAVRILLDAMEKRPASQDPQSVIPTPPETPIAGNNLVLDAIAAAPCRRRPSFRHGHRGRRSSTPTVWQVDEERHGRASPAHDFDGDEQALISYMRMRLAPLFRLEAELRQELGVFEPMVVNSTALTYDECGVLRNANNTIRPASCNALERGYPSVIHLKANRNKLAASDAHAYSQRELNARIADYIQAYDSRAAVDKSGLRRSESCNAPKSRRRRRDDAQSHALWSRREEGRQESILPHFASDIHDLWKRGCRVHNDIRRQLSEDGAVAHFLDNVDRIAQQDYVPTDDDILQARVRTIGASEEYFRVGRSSYFRVIDVGGCRTQRLAWAQFFDSATAIIFVAPLSNFNEALHEDPTVNAVFDSVLLWKRIVASPLLRRVSMILFLNKMDVLQQKIDSGIVMRDFFPHYQGENSSRSHLAVRRYFQNIFRQTFERHERDARGRQLYIQATTATSTREIRDILKACQEVILRHSLRDMGLV